MREFLGLFVAAALAGSGPVMAQETVWLEGEAPASANFAFKAEAMGPAGILSAGKWLSRTMSADEGRKQAPADGYLLRYDFQAPADGDYEVWARVGFELVRPPLEWRVNGGEWKRVGPDVHTTNLMRLATWVEASWLRLGSAALRQGAGSLEIRYREPNGDRMLIALDCLALTRGPFVPEGRLKPGERYDGPQDRQAAERVCAFEAAPTGEGARQRIRLDGLWQAARFDDANMDAGPYEPVREIPAPDAYPLRWMAVKVPSPAADRAELAFAHRLVYRVRVDVPERMAGRSFHLHFAGTNWIAAVFVNGAPMGAHRGVLVPWDIDITRGVKPGQVNEIAVAVKGPMYARDTKDGQSPLEKSRNVPLEGGFNQWSRWVAPIYPSTKGEGDGTACGIVNPVYLTAAGPACVTDVAVRPSFARKRLDAVITVTSEGAARQVTVRCEAVRRKTGQVEHTFPPVTASIEAGRPTDVSVGGEWTDPKLWWPVPDAEMYALRTTLIEGGKAVDVHEQPFGFVEVTTDGKRFRLNGVARNFWNWVSVTGPQATPDEWRKSFSAEGSRFHRFAYDSELHAFFPAREDMLDFADRSGVPGRLSTCVDGMFATYDLNNPLVWENFRDHLEQVARAYRNHPSIVVYSIENELLYINAQNLGFDMDRMENQVMGAVDAMRAIDPLRPCMVDGGGALKGNRLPVDCPHYPEPATDFFPDNAYTLAKFADHSSRWIWDRKRPIVMGETFFYAGKLEDQAWIGGDRVFRGRDEANVGAGRYVRLLMEGYRWQGVAGICPWVSADRAPGAAPSFSDLAVFARKRAHRLWAGRPGAILVKVFNDTLSADPVDFTWELTAGGKRLAGGKERLSIEPGQGAERNLAMTPPKSAVRVDAQLVVRVGRGGSVGFTDRLPVSILPPVGAITPAGPVLVLERDGRIAAWLRARGVQPTQVRSVSALNGRAGLLVIGPNALGAEDAFSPAILAFAARGGRVVALEQDTPLAGAALPAPIRTSERFGGYAFSQAAALPVFANLRSDDLTDWAGDAPTFVRAYNKPQGGARSLIECGDGLNFTAMFEAPVGKGVIVAIQMRVGAKLGAEPAADHLLRNTLAYYAGYGPASGVAAVAAPESSAIWKAVAAAGVRAERADSVAAALNAARHRVVIVPGGAAGTRALLGARAQVDRFTAAGGWVMVAGLDRDGLGDFQKLVGVSQQLRPFRLERVTLEAPGSPLAATLGNRDVTFYGTQEIMFGDYFLSEHVYSSVVEAGDAAPFCRMPDGPDDPWTYKPTFSDNDPYNFVNGLLNSDSWRYIRQIGVGPNGSAPLVFGFRRPEEIWQINLWNNLNYLVAKDVDVVFDGDEASAVRVQLPPAGSRFEIPLKPARRVAKSIALRIRTWSGTPQMREDGPLMLAGLDNVQFVRQIPPEEASRVRPLDNVGGLVAYPRGRGGVFLNQLDLAGGDPNPQNEGRKIRLLATLLQNMGVGSRASAVAIPGVNVRFAPIDITRWCNRHLREREGQPGWFGDRDRDLRELKVGQQYLAGVLYHLSDYVNAPVPRTAMLGGPDAPEPLRALPTEIRGIAVGAKADVVYFLHAAQVNQPLGDWERRDPQRATPELFRYVVRFADGSAADVPVRLDVDVADWRQKDPRPLEGAGLAWSAPFTGAAAGEPRAALYSMAWRNPRPAVSIVSIDLVYGNDGKRATPALLGITLGTRVGK